MMPFSLWIYLYGTTWYGLMRIGTGKDAIEAPDDEETQGVIEGRR